MPDPQRNSSGQRLGKERLSPTINTAIDTLEQCLASKDEQIRLNAASAILHMTPMPTDTYEFTGHLSNRTPHKLLLKSETGSNSESPPPPEVPPGGQARWFGETEGCEFQGKVVYQVEGHPDQEIEMKWYIPLIGYNTISVSTTIPGAAADYEGGHGWQVDVWFYLDEEGSPS